MTVSFTRICALLAGTSLVATPLVAQEADPSEIIVLGRGLELPPGTPAYGSVRISRERLAEDASGTVEHALADVAGFQQFRRSDSRSANPSSQGVTLRALGGNATSRALVLLDGVPLADPFFGSIPFSTLPVNTIGAARITRGGGAGAFGAGTVAGTIELFSADRAQLPLFNASAFYGSANAVQLEGAVSPDVGAGYVSLSGSFARGDGFWTTPEAQRGPADTRARYKSWSTTLQGVAPVGDVGEIQARVALFQDERVLRFAGADNGQEGQDASIRFLLRGAWKVEALAYAQLRNFNNIVISATSFQPTLNQRNTPSTGLGGKLELRPPVGADHLLRIGIDSRFATADMYEETIGATAVRREATGRQVTTGAYIEDDWTLGNVVLTAGARADYWTIGRARTSSRTVSTGVLATTPYPDRNDWEGSFRAGLLWQAAEGVSLRAAGYSSFRLPTINELYRGFSVFPVNTQANAALEPERLKGGEVGLDVAPVEGVRFSATAFYNQLDGAIANVTIGTNLRQRRNVDAILAKGIELSGSAEVGRFDLSASYAFNDSKVEAGPIGGTCTPVPVCLAPPARPNPMDGKSPAQSPRHSASATLGWRAPGEARLAVTARYVGPQFEDDLETDVMPGFVTIDAFARVPILPDVALVGRVENLFDETILTRKVGNSIDLGTPQTFWIGVQIKG